jgi:hypothetical protein
VAGAVDYPFSYLTVIYGTSGASMPNVYEFEDEYTKYYCRSLDNNGIVNNCVGMDYKIIWKS